MAKQKGYDSIVIKGTAYWPFLRKENPMKEGFYTLEIGDLDKETARKLAEIGVSVKKSKPKDDSELDKGIFVSTKASLKYPVRVVDSSNEEMPEEIVEKIGNGTKVKVIVTPYDWTFKRESGVGLGLGTVKVLELKEYAGGGRKKRDAALLGDDDDGYVAPTSKESKMFDDDEEEATEATTAKEKPKGKLVDDDFPF